MHIPVDLTALLILLVEGQFFFADDQHFRSMFWIVIALFWTDEPSENCTLRTKAGSQCRLLLLLCHGMNSAGWFVTSIEEERVQEESEHQNLDPKIRS